MSTSHDPAGARPDVAGDARERRLRRVQQVAGISLALTAILALAKVSVWAATDSIAVLTQALDSALDVGAIALVWLGVRIAAKPADASHHYGHGKAEHLVVFTQTFFLGLIVLQVLVEAARRLSGAAPEVETPWYAFVLLGGSMVADAVRARWLANAARSHGSEALGAGALNIIIDVATAGVALVSLALVRAGVEHADAVGAVVVGIAVGIATVRLGRRAVDVLMDRAPEAPVETIARAAARARGVAETRRVRVRETGRQLFADVTVAAGRTASLERAHDIAQAVEEEIERVSPGTDVVVHVEPMAETGGLVERVQAAASRVDDVHEVHNVSVHSLGDRRGDALHVTLHAKVARATSLQRAHELSELVEEKVEAELGAGVRVDTHIEPLESIAVGTDVTADEGDLVEEIARHALEEGDVVDCHEVLVTSTVVGLAVVAHVRGPGDLPLTRMHEASERIEKRVRASHPEVASVLLHFEPT